MNIPNTMKMNAATRLTEKSRCATAAGATIRSVAGDAPPGRIAGAALVTASRLRVAKASSPSAPSSVGSGVAGSRVWIVATTERPGPERDLFQHFLGERDAHRDPLDDLGEVAGRVVRRQQRELRAGGRGNRRHHALDHLAVERVDGDVDLLSRLDVRELGFLEIGVDVRSVERHKRHQPGSRLHEVSDLSRLVADGSVEGREHAGEGKIALRHRLSGHEFVALARGLVLLRLEHIEIGLCAVERRGGRRLARLGGGQGGDGAVAVGGRLLETLLRAVIGLRELERAVIFQGGPLDVRLSALDLRRRRIDLSPGLGDDRALGLDLAGEAGDGRVLGADARPRRVDARSDSRHRRSQRAGRPCGRPGCPPPEPRSGGPSPWRR